MKKEILRKIGLTEGEIRVYEAVVEIGSSSTGKIMEKSGISSSKIYLILEKLIQKGFVTYNLENNIKKFNASNPVNIIEYLSEQQKKLEETKGEAEELVKSISSKIKFYKEENVSIYRGKKSMLTAYQDILDELKNEDFYFFGAPVSDLEDLQLFFQNLHAKRLAKKIRAKGIADISTKKKYLEIFKGSPGIQIKFLSLPFPHAIGIGNKRVILSLWHGQSVGFEIISERMAQRYRKFFEKLWNK